MISTDMRKMARFVASLAEAGHDAWSIVEELIDASPRAKTVPKDKLLKVIGS